ncbi:flagellar motor protein MotB [Planctomycetota bacterium]
MRTARLVGMTLVCGVLVLLQGGCVGELHDLRIQNETQRSRIAQLEGDLQAARLQLDQLQRQLAGASAEGNADTQAMRDEIAALKEDVAKKKGLIEAMQARLLAGSGQLPVELSTKLEDLAAKYPMIDYDATTGVLKFRSDLLFQPGSDVVASSANEAVQSLCGIINSAEASKFDVIIAGHTDDVRIGKPDTRAKHPTNWHLSVHRAISVLNVMVSSKVDPTRLSARGFGEYRPIEANAPGKKGNPKNRRVEIYIVPQGM